MPNGVDVVGSTKLMPKTQRSDGATTLTARIRPRNLDDFYGQSRSPLQKVNPLRLAIVKMAICIR